MHEKLKSLIRDDQLFYGFLVIILATISFNLGRLSVTEAPATQVPKIEVIRENKDSRPTFSKETALAPTALLGVSVVASRSGTKYHRQDCPGAKQIKPANLITFTTITEAKKAGYTPASNCPGLE